MNKLIKCNAMPNINAFTTYRDGSLLKTIPSQNVSEFNTQGYRSDPFEEAADIRVISIGCSDVFGYALNKEDRFSDIFCQRLSTQTNKKVANWNLGLPGKSNDYIARNLLVAKEILDPTIVLICFTRILRREWFDEDAVCVDYLPGNRNYKSMMPSASFEVLSNYNQNILNFYLNYRLVELLLKDIEFMFTLSLNSKGNLVGLDDIVKMVDTSKYVGYFDVLDHADPDHPGRKSNIELADKFFRRHNQRKIL